MKTSLADGQVKQYQDDGFIHIPGFLDASEVAQLKGAVVETARSMGKKKVAGDGIEIEEGDSFTTRSSPSGSIFED